MKTILLTVFASIFAVNAQAFATLGSVTVQGDPSDLDSRGDFYTISAEDSGFVNSFPHPSEVEAIYEGSRAKLDRQATEVCSGRAYSIDPSSIVATGSNKPGSHIFTVTTTARVFCINGEQ